MRVESDSFVDTCSLPVESDPFRYRLFSFVFFRLHLLYDLSPGIKVSTPTVRVILLANGRKYLLQKYNFSRTLGKMLHAT